MRSIVIAPHPDDEILGAGGTLMKRKEQGGFIAWLVLTEMTKSGGYTDKEISLRRSEIEQITNLFQFDRVYTLGFPAAGLDQIAISEVIRKIGDVFTEFKPEEVFVPHVSDVHSDHKIIAELVGAYTKWFRYPSIKTVLGYETISETGFNLLRTTPFNPNYFVCIDKFLDRKIGAFQIYHSELQVHPFPRSLDAIRALATIRGISAGYLTAEAFELLRQSED